MNTISIVMAVSCPIENRLVKTTKCQGCNHQLGISDITVVCNPPKQAGDHHRVTLKCMKDDKPLTMGIIKHAALRGCCAWKPAFDEQQKEQPR